MKKKKKKKKSERAKREGGNVGDGERQRGKRERSVNSDQRSRAPLDCVCERV